MLRLNKQYHIVDAARNIIKKINFDALKAGVSNLPNKLSESYNISDIEAVTPELASDEDFLRKIHHLLFNIHITDGFLVCPESGRKFPSKFLDYI